MIVFFLLSVYFAASLQEWIFHKYLMHSKNLAIFNSLYVNHILHHKSTLADYTIRDGETEYICVDFHGQDDWLQIVIVFTLNTGFFYMIFGATLSILTIAATIAMMLWINIIVWNTIHPYVHGMDPALICNPPGLAKKHISEHNPIVRFLVENHKRHHDHKNTHYNIVFPGADYLLGTFTGSKSIV